MYRQEISETATELWGLGLVEVMFNTDTNVLVYFTAANYANYRKLTEPLTDEQVSFLDAVIGSSLRDLDPRL